MLSKPLVACLGSVFAICLTATAADRAEDPYPTLHLSLSADRFVPARPSDTAVICSIRNDTKRPFHVPVGYDGAFIHLGCDGRGYYKIEKQADDVRLAWLPPGAQLTVFILKLDDILLLTDPGRRSWKWSHFRASREHESVDALDPPSPLYNRDGTLESKITLRVEIMMGKRSLNASTAVGVNTSSRY